MFRGHQKLLKEKQLTLPVQIPEEKKKLSYIFLFTLFCGASKGFMKSGGTAKKCEINLTWFLF